MQEAFVCHVDKKANPALAFEEKAVEQSQDNRPIADVISTIYDGKAHAGDQESEPTLPL